MKQADPNRLEAASLSCFYHLKAMPEESGSAPGSGWASLSDDYGPEPSYRSSPAVLPLPQAQNTGVGMVVVVGGGSYMISWVI